MKFTTQPKDTVLKTSQMMPMTGGKADLLHDQWLVVRDGKIVFCGPQESVDQTNLQLQTFLDWSDCLVMPGLINAHCHLPMSLFRGLADDLPFEQWLHNYIIPLEGRLVSPEFVRLGTKLAVAELLKSGVTSVVDMYYFENSIAEVCEQMGIRAWVGETVLDFPPPDDKTQSGNNYRILDAMRERWASSPLIHPVVAPHAPYTCSDETLKKAREYADKHSLMMTIHVSETKGEVESSLKQHGSTPGMRLHKLGLLGKNRLWAHGVHLTQEEISLLAKHEGSVVHNPESNMKLGSGIAPIVDMIKANLRLGIGTDGAASNNDLSILGEMDTAAKLQKLAHNDNAAMTAEQALSLATYNGARSLFSEQTLGTLEVGKHADIIALDLQKSRLQPIHNACSQVVYCARGSDVAHTMVHGKLLVSDGQILNFSEEDLMRELRYYRNQEKF